MMETRRFAIIVVLTALNLLLGELWMSYTIYSYARLHIFLLVPIALLVFVPPRPLSKFKPAVTSSFLWWMVALCTVALVFCVVTWDRDLWLTGTVYLGKNGNSFGNIYDVPLEEAAWCVDHTLFVAFWIVSIWRRRPVRKTRGSAQYGLRVVTLAICLAIAYGGYVLLGMGDKYFYLGIQLFWAFLIFAIQAALSCPLYSPYAREYLLGIIVPTAYIVVVDSWAVYHDVWGTSDDFIIGAKFYGLIFEQVLVYTITSALATHGVIAALRVSEMYHDLRPRVRGSALKVFALSLVWGQN